MGLWRFMDYHSEAGNNLIEEWYADISVAAQADFDTTLKNLSIAADWRSMKEFKHLGRQGLCEIRFRTANVQYRLAGFFGPGAMVFSIYVGAIKKQRIYQPPNAFDLAIQRRDRIRLGRGSLRERIL